MEGRVRHGPIERVDLVREDVRAVGVDVRDEAGAKRGITDGMERRARRVMSLISRCRSRSHQDDDGGHREARLKRSRARR